MAVGIHVATSTFAQTVRLDAEGELDRVVEQAAVVVLQSDAAVIAIEIDNAAGRRRTLLRRDENSQRLKQIALPVVHASGNGLHAIQRMFERDAGLLLAHGFARILLNGDGCDATRIGFEVGTRKTARILCLRLIEY